MRSEVAAASLLAEISDLRHAARRSTPPSWWFSTAIFGLVAVGAGLASAAGDAVGLAWWVAALAAASALTVRFHRRRAAASGVVPRHRRYWLLCALVTAVAFAAPVLVAPGPARASAPWLVVAVGYLMAAGLGRSAGLAVVAVLIGCASLVLISVSAPVIAVDVTGGAILIGAGLAARTASLGGP